MFKSGLLGCLFVLFLYALSWLITCGIVWLITLCFGWVFSWAIDTGVWLVTLLTRSIFSVTVKK